MMLKNYQAEQASAVDGNGRLRDSNTASLTAREVLVANSSIQFVDLQIGEGFAASIKHRYFECKDEAAEASDPSLHQIELDESGTFRHPLTDAVADPSETYAIDGRKALESLSGSWIPIPFMRVVGSGTDESEYTEGPSNWARLFIQRDDRQQSETQYRLVLAIDTSIETNDETDSVTYFAPSMHDLDNDTEFRFSAEIEAVGWFVTEPWVDEWLSEVFRSYRTRLQQTTPGADTVEARSLPHLAHYLTMLTVLAEAAVIPTLQLTASTRTKTSDSIVPVDLVLDIGTSRTFAALAEQSPTGKSDHQFDVLPIRNLTKPWQIHQGIFPSRMEFSRASFGNEVFSRWSGRTNAFYWPSIARVGEEAAVLEGEPHNSDAVTGVSSPIQYLWDDRPARQLWRFAGAPGAQRRNSVVSDPMLAFLSEKGEIAKPTSGNNTTKPRFSRSSLTTFFAAELILHAIGAINAPIYRWHRQRDGEPRRLQRIVLTTPASFPDVERDILKSRVQSAVELVWQSMGWNASTARFIHRPPEVVVTSDAATSIQITYLHNELGQKFRGDGQAYFNLVGRTRPGHGSSRSLRIAALDIGGGTSSFAVTTYALADTTSVVRQGHICEGFSIGAESVLKALIERIVLPAMERRLIECRLAEAREFLRGVVDTESSKRSSRHTELRRRLAASIARPVAIALVKELEVLRSSTEDRPVIRTIADLLATAYPMAQSAIDDLDGLATDLGADGYSTADTPIAFTISDVSSVISEILSPVIDSTVRVIKTLDCDLVLLSGWLSRLTVVKEILLEGMPLRPDRILSMHEYRVGSWLPGRSALGNVDDPKTLPALGAWMDSLQEPFIGGLRFKTQSVDLKKRHCMIGRIGENGFILENGTVFPNIDRQSGSGSSAGQHATLTSDVPLLLGIRRSPLSSWPALPMYAIDLETDPGDDPPKLPIRLTLTWTGESEAGLAPPSIVRATDADGIDLAQSEICLRLQTMPSLDGDWRDTGVLDIG